MEQSLEKYSKMPVSKAVIQNALPAVAAMLMVLIYNLADTFFIGQTQDAYQVAAVSLATPVFLVFMSIGTIFGVGGTSVISRAYGEGKKEYAKKICSFCMWSCIAIGILLTIGFLLFMEPLLKLIGASADTWEYTKTYLTIVSFSGTFALIASCFSNILRAEGQAAKAMNGQLIGNILNMVLDAVFIMVFHWDIVGCALATLLGETLGAVYYLYYYLTGKSALSIHGNRAGSAAAPRILCGGKDMGTVQKVYEVCFLLCDRSWGILDSALLCVCQSDRRSVPDRCKRF